MKIFKTMDAKTAWICVFFAGIIEVFWPLGLKYADGTLDWTATVIGIVVSFYLLLKAYEVLPAGTVYTVFTGMGTSGLFLVDVLIIGTPVKWQTVLFFSFIVLGVIGLKLVTEDPAAESEDKITGGDC